MVNIWWRHDSILRKVECAYQVMNVNKGVEFGHLFRFNNITIDPHYPVNEVKGSKVIYVFKSVKRDNQLALLLF